MRAAAGKQTSTVTHTALVEHLVHGERIRRVLGAGTTACTKGVLRLSNEYLWEAKRLERRSYAHGCTLPSEHWSQDFLGRLPHM